MCESRRCLSRLALLLLTAVAGGCSSYYVVKNPVNDVKYYTQDIDRTSGGAVMFKDDRTGSLVTLQNSDIKEIDETEYKTGKYTPR